MAQVKWIAFGLLLISAVQFATTIQQHVSGEVEVVFGRHRGTADRDEDPDRYRELIAFQWVLVVLPALCGFGFLAMIRRLDELDPLSPRSAEVPSVDEFGDYLDKQRDRHDDA